MIASFWEYQPPFTGLNYVILLLYQILFPKTEQTHTLGKSYNNNQI